jgi:Flp pilus assembly protein TadG
MRITLNQGFSHDRRRGGSATLELAILLPLLTTLALLAVDYGRFAHRYVAVTNAARAGAGYASMHPVDPDDSAAKAAWDQRIRQAVASELATNSWFVAGQLTVPASVVTNDGPDLWRIRVEVSYPFQTIVNWPFLPGYNNPVTLRRQVVIRAIR